MDSFDLFAKRLAMALREFGKIPGEENYTPTGIPTNAATLWRHLVAGVERVADALDPPRE